MNQAYSGGDISRMTDIRADYSKPYSALDRTTSALNDIYGQPNNTARNVPSSSMSGSNPQYPSYSMSAQSNIMSSPAMRTAASIYSNQPKSNLSISNNPNNSSQMYSSQTQQQMNYQQMQQNPLTSQQQYHQSQPNMQAPNSRPTTSMQQNQQVGSTNQAQMPQRTDLARCNEVRHERGLRRPSRKRRVRGREDEARLLRIRGDECKTLQIGDKRQKCLRHSYQPFIFLQVRRYVKIERPKRRAQVKYL